MKIKSYFASSIESAIEMARHELGPDALLVTSRKAMTEAKHLGEFEVVFSSGISPAASSRPAGPAPEPDRLMAEVADLRKQIRSMASEFQRASTVSISNLMAHPGLADIFSSLLAAEIHPAFAQHILSGLRARPDVRGGEPMRAALREEIAGSFQTDGAIGRPGSSSRIAAFAGPPGAGKTTLLAKLAVRFGLRNRAPLHIVSADVNRIAAADQLQTYAHIFGLPFRIAETPRALLQIVEELRGSGAVLIDTPGYSPAEMDGAAELASAISSIPEVDRHLVLPANLKPADLSRTAALFQIFHPHKLAFTRLDETSTLGPVLSEAWRTGLPISFVTEGQSVPGDLRIPTRGDLIDQVLQAFTPSVAAVA